MQLITSIPIRNSGEAESSAEGNDQARRRTCCPIVEW
jgi:hypothetical protein